MVALRTYGWPGNVRELANVCERLAILYRGETADASAVHALLPEPEPELRTLGLSDRLDHFEARQIRQALDAADGNVTAAARRLRTDRANLYRRMKRLGIER
jgi:two-component system nitrogen regulation response regulator NtrX